MKVGDSVRKSIDDWQVGELEAAMLHACNAVDGTAAKVFPNVSSNKARFTQFLRDNYLILERMGTPGINLEKTLFPVNVKAPTAGGKADAADVIYAIHRCSHGHGDELPDGFELIPHIPNSQHTHMRTDAKSVQFSDRIIFALLAAAVMSPVNIGQSVPCSYFLSYGDTRFLINEWWGRGAEFMAILTQRELPRITINFPS